MFHTVTVITETILPKINPLIAMSFIVFQPYQIKLTHGVL